MKKLILIDAHAIIHRAYHALPPLSSASGEPTNAVYGFTSVLMRIIKEMKPDYIAACFDLPGPTFRHIAFEKYKAHRPETPGDLVSQFDLTRELLRGFSIPILEKPGFEADDILGTLAKKFEKKKDLETIIVSGDMDLLQLVRPRLQVMAMKRGMSDLALFDAEAVRERYGFGPEHITDFKALKGDPSDNIPGVKGIGEKTAQALIAEFGTVESIYKALKKGSDKIPASVAEKLREGEKDAHMCKELATIHEEAPIDADLDMLAWHDGREEKIREVFQRFGFSSLLKRLNGGEEKPAAQKGKKNKPPSFAKPARPAGGAPAGTQGTQTLAFNSEASEDPAETRITEALVVKDVASYVKDAGAAEFGLIFHEDALFLIKHGEENILRISENLLGTRNAADFLSQNGFIAYDAKAIIRYLRRFGIELGAVRFDPMVAAYLTGSFVRDFSYGAVMERELGRAAVGDAREEFIHLFEVSTKIESKLELEKMTSVYYQIELPLIRILADMEDRGVMLDADFLKKLSKELDKDLDRLTNKIYKEAGEEFNINSTKQLSYILFEKLGIRTAGLRKTPKGGVVSTGASELEKLKSEHEIIAAILDYRELMKIKSTYVDALPELIDPKTGRLHTSFNQVVASTGRLSSSNPNLQNIPIMSEVGRKVREAFVAPKGFLFVSFDYSQIELRVAAHMSNDEKMIEAFAKGQDIHATTAAEIHHVAIDTVTPEMRRAAKTLNFGILYGMGPHALAEGTDMTFDQAKKFIEEYFKNFHGVREYLAQTKQFAEANGYVETIYGRRRYIPEIHSPNWQLKREAERMAINMPIQGTATGDIVKMAMRELDKWIKKDDVEKDVRMILQVHDELVFEIRESMMKKYAPRIKQIMENVVELRVPLVVDIKAGPNWGEQKVM